VTCQTERSQHQNKAILPMRILYSRILEGELEKQAEERAKLKGKRIEAGWVIRSAATCCIHTKW